MSEYGLFNMHRPVDLPAQLERLAGERLLNLVLDMEAERQRVAALHDFLLADKPPVAKDAAMGLLISSLHRQSGLEREEEVVVARAEAYRLSGSTFQFEKTPVPSTQLDVRHMHGKFQGFSITTYEGATLSDNITPVELLTILWVDLRDTHLATYADAEVAIGEGQEVSVALAYWPKDVPQYDHTATLYRVATDS